MPIDNERNQVPQDGMTLPQHFFVSEEIFEQETKSLFQGDWFCIGRREQLNQPGDYFLADVVGESLIVTLDSEGQLQAMYNVCRHRGSRLATEPRGAFSHCRIRCPYHRWTYDCAGELLAAPNMAEEFQVADWPLRHVTVDVWEGFVFINLANDPPPIATAFEAFWEQLSPWSTGDLVVAHEEKYELATNWKMVYQNFNECYHCRSVHPGLDELSPVEDCSNDFSEGPFLGGPMQLSSESMTIDGKRTAPVIRTLDEARKHRVYYYTLLPNMLFGLHPDFVLAWRLEPRSPGSTKITAQWLYEPEAIASPGFDPRPAIEFWDRTNRQDWDICQSSYQGVCSRGYQPGPWSTSESIPKSFDRSVLAALGDG
ncbi:MAG: aromatic ring-hydroxylating dioxygenase subunit alpha [Planctomycetota bacterium]